MSPLVLLICYCGLILLASLAGGWLPIFVRLTHTRMQVATSFVAGLMLGVGLLHLLPHGWQYLRSVDLAVWWLVGGFLGMFFIQRFFQFHQHEIPPEAITSQELDSASGPLASVPLPDHHHAHGHHHHHPHAEEEGDAHSSAPPGQRALNLTWGGAALGLTMHTLADGVALAASLHAGAQAEHGTWLLGFSTFLVIILHKPFDAMAISTLMAGSGWSKSARHWVNALFALAIPVGAGLFHLGFDQFADHGQLFIGAALAFAAGTFLCIATSDLLPEVQFHSHDRIKLSIALLLGLFLAILIGVFEGKGHEEHDHTDPPTAKRFAEIRADRPDSF